MSTREAFASWAALYRPPAIPRFKISTLVIPRRIHDVDRLPRDVFRRAYDDEIETPSLALLPNGSVENDAGNVFSIEKVGDEVRALADELSEWAEARPEDFSRSSGRLG